MVGLPRAICSVYNSIPVSFIFHPSETLQKWSKVTRLSGDHWAKGKAPGKHYLVPLGWSPPPVRLNMNRQKYRNLLRELCVAVAPADPANPYRSLEIQGAVAKIEDDTDYRFLNAASRKHLNRDAASEEKGSAEERAVISVEPERVIVFPPQEDTK